VSPEEKNSLERFSRGEPIAVSVDRLERELAALWQEASRAGSGDGLSSSTELGATNAVARAALWNIIVPAHGAASLQETKRMVDDMAPAMPARVIVLARAEDDGADGGGAAGEAGPSRVQATIESNVVSRASGARVVYSEEITLTGRRDDDGHFGSLVRSLQIPGLPTATLWIDSTAVEEILTRDLLPLSDRLILDTGRCSHPGELGPIARLVAGRAERRIDVGDLGWLRLSGFRLLFAGLFDPPVGGAPLLGARRVTIEHRPGGATSALVLGSWLATQLGWTPVGAARQDGGALDFHLVRDPQRDPKPPAIELSLQPTVGECGTSGIVALTLETSSGETYAVRRTAGNHAEVSAPIAPPRSMKLDSRSDAELCVGALGPRGRDPLLARVLTLAGSMADLIG